MRKETRGDGAGRIVRFAYVALLIAAIPYFGLSGKAHAANAAVDALSVQDAASTIVVDHSSWAEILNASVVEGDDGLNRFRYADVGAEHKASLKAYLEGLQNFDPTTLNRDEQFAFWVNLYNAATIDVVLEHYPVDSIRSIKLSGPLFSGPWRKKFLNVGGYELSLDMIEHEILRGKWTEPRVHYAVNCASVGCPNLGTIPFAGATLEAQLDQAARDYVNHPRGADVKDGKLTVSSIYDWFKEDFGDNDAGVIAHLEEYADADLKAALSGITKVSKDQYDWSLNDATS